MTKLVSYILPVYNAAPYLKAAVGSILSQTYSNIELIAIDDGSTDGSGDILRQFAATDSRMRVIARENRGLVATLNEGLDLATGDLIARMDADDIAYPDRTARQVELFEQDPELCLLGMGADYLFFGDKVIRKLWNQRETEEIKTESIFNTMFVHPSVMLNNKIIQGLGARYNPAYPSCEDAELWSRLLRTERAMIMTEPGIAWRQSHDSVRTRHFREQNIDGFTLTGNHLNDGGVEGDFSVFSTIFRPGSGGQAPHREALKDALRRAYDGRSLYAKTQAAYDRGFASLVGNLLEGIAAFGDLPDGIAMVDELGFGHMVGRRLRLQASLTRVSSPAMAQASIARGRTLWRQMKSKPLTSLVELPAAVVECL